MSSIKAFGIVGAGGLGVLVAGRFISEAFQSSTQSLFSFLLVVFVIAGAVALVARAL